MKTGFKGDFFEQNMNEKFTNKAHFAVNVAFLEAAALGDSYVGTEHLLLALAQSDTDAGALLCSLGMGAEVLKKRLAGQPRLFEGKRECRDMTPKLKKLLLKAAAGRKAGCKELLCALLSEECAAKRIVDGFIAAPRLYEKAEKLSEEDAPMQKTQKSQRKPTPLLDKTGCDLTEKALCGGLDPVIGREKEEERVIQILLRRTKNNPCLIGEPGVGKTAVAESLALRIAEGRVPDALKGKRIMVLDLPALVAGTKYRGEFEDKLRGIIEETKNAEDVILFADEIHTMVGAGAAEGAIDASNILKPYLARGEIQIIGATTLKEYKKHIEKDGALERRFQCVMLKEPDRNGCLQILKGLRHRYENHHGVIISDSALEAAVDLSLRYIGERCLPDKAIDLMDEAAARCRLLSESSKRRLTVERCDVEGALEAGTGIIADQGLRGRRLAERLKASVCGQDEAAEKVAAALAAADRLKSHGPCTLLFVGGKGVGKQSLAKATARELFGSEDAFVCFNAEDYRGGYGTEKLLGVRGGDGGVLTEKVRRSPLCLLFFDNVNKADTELLSVIRKIIEEGVLADADGLKVSFRSCYLVLSVSEEKGCTAGFTAAERANTPVIRELAEAADETVSFAPPKEKELVAVAEGCFESLKRELAHDGISLCKSESFLRDIAAHEAALGVSHGGLYRKLKRSTARLIAEEALVRPAEATLFWEDGKEKLKISVKNC